jgi:hypothetical protein
LDLSPTRFDRDADAAPMPGDLAVLMVGIAVRQAASHTAAAQATCGRSPPDPRLFAPVDGAFNGPVANAMTAWKKE